MKLSKLVAPILIYHPWMCMCINYKYEDIFYLPLRQRPGTQDFETHPTPPPPQSIRLSATFSFLKLCRYVHHGMGVCCIVCYIDGMLFEIFFKYWNKWNFKNFVFNISCFLHVLCYFQLWKVPLHLLVKWEVVSPNSRFYAVSNISRRKKILRIKKNIIFFRKTFFFHFMFSLCFFMLYFFYILFMFS